MKQISSNKFLFIKVEDEPRFIQYNDYYYKKLIEDNYSFFLQIEEEGYSDLLLVGNYPFMYGDFLLLFEQNKDKIQDYGKKNVVKQA